MWADHLARVVLDPGLHARMSAAAPVHAAGFSWDVTVDGLLRTYQHAVHDVRLARPAANGEDLALHAVGR
jgi:D-inositol-3-phosphate glycosyltransferase